MPSYNSTKKYLIKITAIYIILVQSLLFSTLYVSADWGDSDEDCADHHGITPQYARYIPNLNITLDGVDNESVWQREDVYDYVIPVMNINTSDVHYTKYVHMKYLYDEDDLYIRTYWDDSSVPQISDNFFMCWDINCTNFTVGMFLINDSMETPEMNERSDNWSWQQNFLDNGSTSAFKDQCYDNNGWVEDPSTDHNDPIAGSIYGTWLNGEGHYQLEIHRKLTTAEPEEDTQLEIGGSKRFSIAIDNSYASADHAVSWTYELFLTNSTDPAMISTNDSSSDDSEDLTDDDSSITKEILAFPPGVIVLLGIGFIGVLSVYMNHKVRRQ